LIIIKGGKEKREKKEKKKSMFQRLNGATCGSPIHPSSDGKAEESKVDTSKGPSGTAILDMNSNLFPSQRGHSLHRHFHLHAFSHLQYVEKRPCASTGLSCAVFGLLAILLIGLFASGVNVITVSTDVPMYLHNHEAYIGYTALLQAQATANSHFGETSESQERSTSLFPLEIVYESKSGETLLNRESLQKIKEFEEEFAFNGKYMDYCQLTYAYHADNPRCIRHTSPVNFYDKEWWKPAIEDVPNPTIASIYNLVHYAIPSKMWATSNISYTFADPKNPDFDEVTLTDENIAEITNYWATYCSEFPCQGSEYNPDTPFAYLYPTGNGSYVAFNASNYFWSIVDAGFGVQDGGAVGYDAVALRSSFYFGGPLRKEDGTLYETEGSDYDTMLDEVGTWLYTEFQGYLEDGIEGINVYWDGETNGMFEQYKSHLLLKDGMLAFGSVVFVFSYLMFMLRSFWLAAMGMGMILANFLPAIFLYRLVGGFEYFGTLNVLGVFIIMGIGADDIFVFMDTWAATQVDIPNKPLHKKLSHTLAHAGKAMATTSASTALSFLANTTSSFPAVYTFGTFCTFLVICNFFSICILWPCVVAMSEYYFKGASFLCMMKPRRHWGYKYGYGPEHILQPGKIELFFKDTYYPFLHKLRYPILAIYGCILIVYVIFAAQLQPDPDAPQFLPSSNNYVAFSEVKRDHFLRDATMGKLVLNIPIGIESLDQEDCDDHVCDPTVPGDWGTVLWDDEMSSTKSEYGQKLVLELCADMQYGEDEGFSHEDRKVYTSNELLPSPVRCILNSFKTWCEVHNCPKTKHEEASTLEESDYIVDEEFFDAYMREFLGHLQLPSDPDYVAGQTNWDVWSDSIFSEDVYSVNVLRFALLKAYIDVDVYDMDYREGIEIYNTWSEWLENWKSKSQSEAYNGQTFLSNAFITDDMGVFQFCFLQEQIKTEAVTGILLSLLLAYIVLCIATTNWIISLFSIFSILVLVLGVIAFTVWNGWKLGVIESVVYVMVVGLSVDYTVHLSEAYLASGKKTREDRCRVMLFRMGVSVVSGAFSTLGATFFLLLATIIFFTKFGSIIFFLISQSLIFSLTGYSALLDTFGPQIPQRGENIRRHVDVFVLHQDQWKAGYVMELDTLKRICQIELDEEKELVMATFGDVKRRHESGSLHFVGHIWSALYKFFNRMWSGYKDWYSSDISRNERLEQQNKDLNDKIDELTRMVSILVNEKYEVVESIPVKYNQDKGDVPEIHAEKNKKDS